MSRPVLDLRLLAEVHAAFDDRYRFVEMVDDPGIDGTWNLGIPRNPVVQLQRLVCKVPDAVIAWSGQKMGEPTWQNPFRGYLALRWCFNARVDAGRMLLGTAHAKWALTGISLQHLDEPARVAWDAVPWDRLALALHLAAKPLGLVLPGVVPPETPEGWQP